MERKKIEPSFEASELGELNFRTRRRTPARQATEEWAKWFKAALALLALIVVALGLIEWNARRQAAAMTAELMRPMTPAEEAALSAQTKDWERKMAAETAAELAEANRQLWDQTARRPTYVPRPLKPGQRCMQGRRLERIHNGWQQLQEPC